MVDNACNVHTHLQCTVYISVYSCSPLPSDGIILRPCPKDSEGEHGSIGGGVGVGVSSSMLGGASIHDESFEDEFSDMEGSVTDGNAGIVSMSMYVHVFVSLPPPSCKIYQQYIIL